MSESVAVSAAWAKDPDHWNRPPIRLLQVGQRLNQEAPVWLFAPVLSLVQESPT